MHGSVGSAEKELGDLKTRQGALEGLRDAVTERREGEVSVLRSVVSKSFQMVKKILLVTYHHGVNGRIDEDEHPNRRAHEADTGPHTQHGASMMVGLQGGATLALRDNDHRVHDLIEFTHVKDEAPKGQAFVPQPANVRRVGVTIVA